MVRRVHAICFLSCLWLVDNCLASPVGQWPAYGAREERVALPRYEISYATYLGGRGEEQLREVIPYKDGSVLVGGQTNSLDLPVTDGVVQPEYGGEPPGKGHPGIYGGDCFLTRLSDDGSKIMFTTYFGGAGTGGLASAFFRLWTPFGGGIFSNFRKIL